MASKFLTIVDFNDPSVDPANPVPADDSNIAVFRRTENPPRIYVSAKDVPKGSIINLLHLTNYVYFQLPDPTAIAQIMAAEKNASDGKIEYLIIDESIVSQSAAIQRATSAKMTLGVKPLTVDFSTYIKGWKSGQQFTYINSARDIRAVLTVQEVSKTLKTKNRTLSKVKAALVIFKTTAEVEDELQDAVKFPKKPREIQMPPS